MRQRSLIAASIFNLPREESRGANGSELQPIPATCFSGGEINQNPQPVSTDFALTLTLPTGSATGPTTYTLAYLNITGGAAGSITVFPPNPAIPNSVSVPYVTVPIPLPAQNINVELVYFPGGGGGGPTNAFFDEYDATNGRFANDTFVHIFAPSTSTNVDSAENAKANSMGYWPTKDSDLLISALTTPTQFDDITAAGESFDGWVTDRGMISSSQSANTPAPNVIAPANVTSYSIALYRAPCPAGYRISRAPSVIQCLPVTCPPGQEYSAEAEACLFTCPKGYLYNMEKGKCFSACPATCRNGCFPFTVNSTAAVCRPLNILNSVQ